MVILLSMCVCMGRWLNWAGWVRCIYTDDTGRFSRWHYFICEKSTGGRGGYGNRTVQNKKENTIHVVTCVFILIQT